MEAESIGNISGMRWQDAQKKAEALVYRAGFLGFEKLRKSVGCHKRTLRKAINDSSKLTQAESDYTSTLKAVGLTKRVLATYEKTSKGPSVSDTEVEEILSELLKEVEKSNPAKLEQTKKELENMTAEGRRQFAETYKDTTLKKDGPKTPRQYKKV